MHLFSTCTSSSNDIHCSNGSRAHIVDEVGLEELDDLWGQSNQTQCCKGLAQEWAGPTPDLQRDDEADGYEVVVEDDEGEEGLEEPAHLRSRV